VDVEKMRYYDPIKQINKNTDHYFSDDKYKKPGVQFTKDTSNAHVNPDPDNCG